MNMTLQETAQILGGIGVIASLIYVAIQIRNNARAVRAATYHQVSNTFITHWDSLAHSPETLSVMLRGGKDFASLSGHVEQSRYYLTSMATMRRFENAWFQYKVGVLKESDWKAIAYDMDALFAYPGTRFAWDGIKNRSSVEFRKYVDEVSKRQAALAPPPPPAKLPKPKVKK
jgi:hypothetical protein